MINIEGSRLRVTFEKSKAFRQNHQIYAIAKWNLPDWPYDDYADSVSWKTRQIRDMIASTGLVILLKLDSNRRFFSPCDLKIWWMTPKNKRAPLLCYFKLFASFRSHWWIQTGVTVQKRLIWVKIDDSFLAVWPCSLMDDPEKPWGTSSMLLQVLCIIS